MKPSVGLYYPFIHFKDDAWLKAAALYWDKMGRIVPHRYETRDSETVKRLAGDLDFIENFNPREWCGPLCDRFAVVVREHGDALRARYDIRKRHNWPHDADAAANAPPSSEPQLAYIHGGKMNPQFVEQLEQEHLAVRRSLSGSPDADLLWVGMHPKLATVYMMALAAQTADDHQIVAERLLHPLTDDRTDHLAMGSWTMERLALGLLGDDLNLPNAPITQGEVTTSLASIAIESVVPRDLAAVDVERVIAFRNERRAELTAFQGWMQSFASSLIAELSTMSTREALEAHLDVVVARDVNPQMGNLRNQLERAGIEAARSVINIKLEAPPLMVGAAAALGFVVNPVVGAASGLAIGLFDVALDARRNAEALDLRPAYLMYLEEDLKPQRVLDWVRMRLRRFFVGR